MILDWHERLKLPFRKLKCCSSASSLKASWKDDFFQKLQNKTSTFKFGVFWSISNRLIPFRNGYLAFRNDLSLKDENDLQLRKNAIFSFDCETEEIQIEHICDYLIGQIFYFRGTQLLVVFGEYRLCQSINFETNSLIARPNLQEEAKKVMIRDFELTVCFMSDKAFYVWDLKKPEVDPVKLFTFESGIKTFDLALSFDYYLFLTTDGELIMYHRISKVSVKLVFNRKVQDMQVDRDELKIVLLTQNTGHIFYLSELVERIQDTVTQLLSEVITDNEVIDTECNYLPFDNLQTNTEQTMFEERFVLDEIPNLGNRRSIDFKVPSRQHTAEAEIFLTTFASVNFDVDPYELFLFNGPDNMVLFTRQNVGWTRSITYEGQLFNTQLEFTSPFQMITYLDSINKFAFQSENKMAFLSPEHLRGLTKSNSEIKVIDDRSGSLLICSATEIARLNLYTSQITKLFSVDNHFPEESLRMTSFSYHSGLLHASTDSGSIVRLNLNSDIVLMQPELLHLTIDLSSFRVISPFDDEIKGYTSVVFQEENICICYQEHIESSPTILTYQNQSGSSQISHCLTSVTHGLIFIAAESTLQVISPSNREASPFVVQLPKIRSITLLRRGSRLLVCTDRGGFLYRLPKFKQEQQFEFPPAIQVMDIGYNLLLVQEDCGRLSVYHEQSFELISQNLLFSLNGNEKKDHLPKGFLYFNEPAKEVLCFQDLWTYKKLPLFSQQPENGFFHFDIQRLYNKIYVTFFDKDHNELESLLSYVNINDGSLKSKIPVEIDSLLNLANELNESNVKYFFSKKHLIRFKNHTEFLEVISFEKQYVHRIRNFSMRIKIAEMFTLNNQPRVVAILDNKSVQIWDPKSDSIKCDSSFDELNPFILHTVCIAINEDKKELYGATMCGVLYKISMKGRIMIDSKLHEFAFTIERMILTSNNKMLICFTSEESVLIFDLNRFSKINEFRIGSRAIIDAVSDGRVIHLVYREKRANHVVVSQETRDLANFKLLMYSQFEESDTSNRILVTNHQKTQWLVKKANGFLNSPNCYYEQETQYLLSLFELMYLKEVFYDQDQYIGPGKIKLWSYFENIKPFYYASHALKRSYSMELVAVFHKNIDLLKILLVEKNYNFNWESFENHPMQAAFNSLHYKLVVAILNFCKKKNIKFTQNYEMTKWMLTREEYEKKFLTWNCSTVKFASNDDELLTKNGNYPDFIMHKARESVFTMSDFQSLELVGAPARRHEPADNSIEIYDLKICWDFNNFTNESALFLQRYAQSASDEFILSPYYHIVKQKWRQAKMFFRSLIVIQWLHVIFYYLYTMNPQNSLVLGIDYFMLMILTVYEIWNLLATEWKYFKHFMNYLDIFNIVICFIMLTATAASPKNNSSRGDLFRVFQLISLVIVSWRGFTFFKFITPFSHIIQMTSKMITKSVTIVVVIVYFVLCFAVVFSILSDRPGDNGINGSFRSSISQSYSIVFGSIPELEKYTKLHTLMIVVGSILLPIFFINFLIAQLTNAYESMESRQHAIALREMADSLWEYEKMIAFMLKLFDKSRKSDPGYIFIAVSLQEDDQRLDCAENSESYEITKEIRKSSKKLTRQIQICQRSLDEGQAEAKLRMHKIERSISKMRLSIDYLQRIMHHTNNHADGQGFQEFIRVGKKPARLDSRQLERRQETIQSDQNLSQLSNAYAPLEDDQSEDES